VSVKSYIFTIPANTLQSSPHGQEINLAVGHVTRIDIGFRNGCNNLVNIALYDGLKQILPDIEGQSLRGNDHVYSFPEDIQIPSQGKTLMIRGWSPTTLYAHDVTFWFIMENLNIDTTNANLIHMLTSVPTNTIVK
jgi:hypothetical protein